MKSWGVWRCKRLFFDIKQSKVREKNIKFHTASNITKKALRNQQENTEDGARTISTNASS